MNAMTPNQPLVYSAAYDQLSGLERLCVDGYVVKIENEYGARNEQIGNALHRAIPQVEVDASDGILARPFVRAAIVERIREIAAATEFTPRRIIREIGLLGLSNIADYGTVEEDGTFKVDLTRATHDQLAAIKTFKIKEHVGKGGTYTKEIEFVLHDKTANLALLAKMAGLTEQDSNAWREQTARPVEQTAIPAHISDEALADDYARIAGGG